MIEHVLHTQDEVKISPGDVVILYTDGLTESTDGQGEMFGEERLERVARQGMGGSAEELLRTILREAESFCGRTTYDDDVTLVILKAL